MSAELAAAVIGAGFVGILNLIGFAFTYGRLTAVVTGLVKDVDRLKCKVFGEVR